SRYRILYPTNLKYFAPFTTNKNTAIIGGLFDRIIPFSFVQDLAAMLKKPLFSYPGGHVSIFPWMYGMTSQINETFGKNVT
ncbi:MAG: hypothetical protein ACTSP4_07205, partial [Candidatus Hodarchaeales archaeon]